MQVVSKSFLGDTNHRHAEEHLSSSTDTSTENRIYSEEMEEPILQDQKDSNICI